MMECSKTDCEKVAEKFFDYLDKELCSDDCASLETHLEKCRNCFGIMEFEKRLREHFKKSTHHCCPDALKEKIKKIIDKY